MSREDFQECMSTWNFYEIARLHFFDRNLTKVLPCLIGHLSQAWQSQMPVQDNKKSGGCLPLRLKSITFIYWPWMSDRLMHFNPQHAFIYKSEDKTKVLGINLFFSLFNYSSLFISWIVSRHSRFRNVHIKFFVNHCKANHNSLLTSILRKIQFRKSVM